MANFHDIVFSIAGPRSVVNEAVLLMAQNVAECEGDAGFERLDDPAVSYSRYRALLDKHYRDVFAGKESCDSYLSVTGTPSFADNGEICSVALRYACAGGLNEDDLGTFLGALTRRVGDSERFSACTVHADEYDDYDEIVINYGCDGALDGDDWCNAGALLKECASCRAADPVAPICSVPKLDAFTDPDELARKHAVCLWNDWGGESVMGVLVGAGVLPDDEDEAEEMFSEWSGEAADYYLAGNRGLFDPDVE